MTKKKPTTKKNWVNDTLNNATKTVKAWPKWMRRPEVRPTDIKTKTKQPKKERTKKFPFYYSVLLYHHARDLYTTGTTTPVGVALFGGDKYADTRVITTPGEIPKTISQVDLTHAYNVNMKLSWWINQKCLPFTDADKQEPWTTQWWEHAGSLLNGHGPVGLSMPVATNVTSNPERELNYLFDAIVGWQRNVPETLYEELLSRLCGALMQGDQCGTYLTKDDSNLLEEIRMALYRQGKYANERHALYIA